MQYASGGELYDYLGCHRTLPEDEARRIFRQIASAIYYCHKNKICHRDLKLENILLDEEGNAQIADFGLSNIFDERRRMNTFCGSPLYASPEIVKGTPYKGPEVDCWSLGVLLYTLIYGTMPFDGRNFKDLVSQISEGRYEEPTNKSSASGLIRRLLTPEIAKRATIFDVCIDRWVNQGYTEPLVKIAEKMTSEALLKARKLGGPKIYSEGTNKIEERVLPDLIPTQQNKEHIIVQEKIAEPPKSVQQEASQKASLFEQMLKYDVNFVMNQLLCAVESANATVKVNEDIASHCENMFSALKPRNGENTGRVESAYVIPIFDVTSVMPKPKNTNRSDCDQSSQMSISQNTTAVDPQPHSTSENKNSKTKTKKKLPNPNALGGKPLQNGIDQENLANNSKTQGVLKKKEVTTTKDAGQLLTPNDNLLPRMPSVKMKKPHENNLLFGPKKPFFRSKNHSLSLARIFSMKYEKLVLDALKVPERKQKPPGKITIPATFDPSTSCDETPERKEIVILFPTVSVSENKEKIEKKIDKIKKAALNMNLIRRSNTNNRLRIEKFLKSQRKKMQDLVCEDHRSIDGSMEYIDQISGFPSNFCSFDNGKLNPFSIKHHKKINFMNSNLSNTMNPFGYNVSHGEKWKLFGSENFLLDEKENLAAFGICKSKSDIQFPSNYAECHITNSGYRSSYSSGYNSLSNTLSVPDSDCSLLRSASDSDGLNLFRHASAFGVDKETFKCTQGNIFNVHYNKENSNIGETFYQNGDENLDKTLDEEAIQHLTAANDLLKNMEFDIMNIDQEFYSKINLQNKNEEKQNIRRSNSFVSSEKLSGNLLQNIKSLLLTTSLRKNNNLVGCYENSDGSKQPSIVNINVLEESNKMKEEKGTIGKNSLDSHQSYNNETSSFSWNEIKNMGANDFVKNCLQTSKEKQELLTLYRQNGGKCLSYPDLTAIDQIKSKNIPNEYISVDRLDMTALENDDLLDFITLNRLENIRKSINRSTHNKEMLQSSDNVDEAFYDFLPRYSNRTNSLSHETLINLESLLEYERKLSLPQGSLGKAKFLSKFLNDLERREQMSGTSETFPTSNQRSNPRTVVKPPKRSKMEKKSQSFLQLMALKRIQEAEKELEKVERNNRVDLAEEEPGSLLEALKTYGYKGVISQRFQNQVDDDEILPLNVRNRRVNFSARNFSPDVSYFQAMDYDTTPYMYSAYDDNNLDLEMLNGITMPSLYEMYPAQRQSLPRQYIYDWLTANQNNEYSTSFASDLMLEPEILNTTKESGSPSYRSKKNPRTSDEASCSDNFEFPKNHIKKEKPNEEQHPKRHTSAENGDASDSFGPDRNGDTYEYIRRDKSGDTSDYVRRDRNSDASEYSRRDKKDDTSDYIRRDRNGDTSEYSRRDKNDDTLDYIRRNRNKLHRTPSAPERTENYPRYSTFDRNTSEDNDELSTHVRSDRSPLLRTSSAPEEEKEESVQDRIWRKSFYSRFNNSVLSRKERSSFLDTSDSRAGFRDRSMTPFRGSLDRRSLSSKRSSKRRSSSSSDRTLDSGLSTSMNIPLERTETSTTLTNETLTDI